jgi:hypothetical protein
MIAAVATSTMVFHPVRTPIEQTDRPEMPLSYHLDIQPCGS